MYDDLSKLIIIPAFNEGKNIAGLISEIRDFDSGFDIVVVDDGSHDDTGTIARQSDVPVITMPFNVGIGGAMQTGFKYARNHAYDIAIQVDGDGQHLPQEIPKLLTALVGEKNDVVIGSRYLSQNDYKTPFFRRMGMFIFSFINSRIAHKRFTDNTSGFRAYNAKAIRFLAFNYPNDYPEVEAVAVLAMHKFRMKEVAVEMRPRQFGVSSIDALDAIYYMIKVSLALLVNVSRKNESMNDTVS